MRQWCHMRPKTSESYTRLQARRSILCSSLIVYKTWFRWFDLLILFLSTASFWSSSPMLSPQVLLEEPEAWRFGRSFHGHRKHFSSSQTAIVPLFPHTKRKRDELQHHQEWAYGVQVYRPDGPVVYCCSCTRKYSINFNESGPQLAQI